jgi:hypothetical protein
MVVFAATGASLTLCTVSVIILEATIILYRCGAMSECRATFFMFVIPSNARNLLFAGIDSAEA